MTKQLTREEQVLLQRYYDADPLPEGEVDEVEALLNRSQPARVFMAALEELTEATVVAVEFAWDASGSPPAEDLADTALQAAALTEAPLADLAPMLERYSDGEALDEEVAIVAALAEEREDVADYLANLDRLRASVQATHEEMISSVSFDGFWDSLETKLDAEDSTFDPEEHRVLLYRYHDGEATPEERARVDSWLERGDEQVATTLEALTELNLAVTAGVEMAQEDVDFAGMWHRVENAIDDEIEAQGDNVLSLERRKRDRDSDEQHQQGFLSNYRQGVVAAVAAAICVALVAGLFQEQLFGGGEKVIVEKTVVIVDSVEYQPGASVMVNTPMKKANATVTAADDASAEEEEEPTVIWLLDTDEPAAEEAGPAPAEGGPDAGDQNDEESQEQPQTDDVDEQPI